MSFWTQIKSHEQVRPSLRLHCEYGPGRGDGEGRSLGSRALIRPSDYECAH